MVVTKFKAAVAAATLAALGVCAVPSAPAFATHNPPAADPALIGTWNNPASVPNIVKITISDEGDGAISVDAYGSCDGSLCEFGNAPATVYGKGVTSATGRTFSVDQSEPLGRSVLLGSLSSRGILTVAEYTTFMDGSGRQNFEETEHFLTSAVEPTSISGVEATDYPVGASPAPKRGMLATWVDPSGAYITKIGVAAEPGGGLSLAASSACCDLGTAVGAIYGKAITSTHGTRFLAQFADAPAGPILIAASYSTRHGTLAVTMYREFTDGSGRSNYAVHETLTRA